ncbi:DUF5926 family protein [soil metagenome]
MGKKSRRKVKPVKEQMPFVSRTFEGLPGEGDWIALREFVPAATSNIKLADSDRVIKICSLLPGAGVGLVRPDDEIWIGLQVAHNFGDISRDLAHAIALGLESPSGTPIVMTDPGVGPRLQDIIAPDSTFDVTVHDGFDYWIAGVDDSEQAAELMESANEGATPTAQVEGVEHAYWTQFGGRSYVRWVRTEDEDDVLTALARLRTSGGDGIGDDTRLIGMFRAHGLLVPVWELDAGQDAASLVDTAQEFEKRLTETLTLTGSLSAEERSARSSLANRQLTIR